MFARKCLKNSKKEIAFTEIIRKSVDVSLESLENEKYRCAQEVNHHKEGRPSADCKVRYEDARERQKAIWYMTQHVHITYILDADDVEHFEGKNKWNYKKAQIIDNEGKHQLDLCLNSWN